MRKYEDFEQVISRACACVAKKSFSWVNMDDYTSIAFLTFCRLEGRYPKLSRSQFSNKLFVCIINDLLTWIEMERKQTDRIYNCAIDVCSNRFVPPDTYPDLNSQIENLSGEAKQVVNMIFNSPSELFQAANGPRAMRRSIKDWCREQGWTWKMVHSVFKELGAIN